MSLFRKSAMKKPNAVAKVATDKFATPTPIQKSLNGIFFQQIYNFLSLVATMTLQ